jgi:hypothetical protein
MFGEGLFGADTSARFGEARTRIPETLEPELRSSAHLLIREMIIRGEVLGMMMFDAVGMPGRFDSSAGERYIRNFHSRTWKEANASLG